MARVEQTGTVGEKGDIDMKKAKEIENVRGRVVILKPEQSEIAKNLDIKEKGVYGTRFK